MAGLGHHIASIPVSAISLRETALQRFSPKPVNVFQREEGGEGRGMGGAFSKAIGFGAIRGRRSYIWHEYGMDIKKTEDHI